MKCFTDIHDAPRLDLNDDVDDGGHIWKQDLNFRFRKDIQVPVRINCINSHNYPISYFFNYFPNISMCPRTFSANMCAVWLSV